MYTISDENHRYRIVKNVKLQKSVFRYPFSGDLSIRSFRPVALGFFRKIFQKTQPKPTNKCNITILPRMITKFNSDMVTALNYLLIPQILHLFQCCHRVRCAQARRTHEECFVSISILFFWQFHELLKRR